MVVRLFLLLAVVYQSRGQTAFYDLGNGIFEDTTEIIADDSENRKLCYDGENLYYVDADVDASQIRELNIGGTDPVVRSVAGAIIDSLSCGCGTLAFTYRLGGRTILQYVNLDDEDVYILMDLGSETVTALRLQIELGALIVVSSTSFYKFSLDIQAGPIHLDLDTPLNNAPKCVAVYRDGSRWYLFISFALREQMVVVCFDNDEVFSQDTLQVQRPDGGNARIACLDVDGDSIFFLHESSGSLQWEINSYDVSGWFGPPSPIYAAADRDPVINGDDEDFDDCVNGLDICGTACEADCGTDCDCDTDCGFCASGDNTCLCENSQSEYCVYTDSSLADECSSRLPPINAMCVIKNARAQRRRPDEVKVLGVSQVEAVITVDRRTASTGRWPIDVLPPRMTINEEGTPLWISGFSAMTPSSARGKRFGVFLADINPEADDLLTERINCIVTEASKFINKYYTYCGYVTGSVTLEAMGLADSQVNMNLDQIRWLFTRVDLGTVDIGTPTTPNCVSNGNPLTCTLNDLSMDDEGIYEVYRARRYLRTWHPIFCLAVRACPDNMFGTDCDSSCTPSCVHGKCDPSGECVCFPGWRGEDCNTACDGEGSVGQNCDIQCSDIHDDNTDCKDLLFCLPGKIGCYCRSGLKPPECWKPCPDDTWGPNCMMDCDNAGCNARTGVI